MAQSELKVVATFGQQSTAISNDAANAHALGIEPVAYSTIVRIAEVDPVVKTSA